MAIDHDSVLRMLLAERNKLLGYIATIIPDEHLAEDIFQEVSVAAVRKHEQIQSPEHLMGWLRKAARLSALKMRRNRNAHPMVFETDVLDALEGQWEEEDGRSSSDEMEMLQKCMQKLQGYPRQLIDLKYGEGLNGAAIAERVGRNVAAVYVALGRAHRALTQCIERGMNQLKSRENGHSHA